MSHEALLQGDTGKLLLEIIDYENKQAKTVADANWLRAKLEVEAGPFTGSIRLALTAAELMLIHRELATASAALKGTVDFGNMEGNLRLKVEFARTGTVCVKGTVTPNEGEGNVLHYNFCSDPITLEATVQAFGRLVEQFPVKLAVQSPG